jgi:hypothetical protein
MSLINYTGSITLRQTKGSSLTFVELDTNFSYLNSGSTGGIYISYENTIPPLFMENGDGFGNILVGEVSPSLLSGITSSQLVTLDATSPSNKLYFTTSSLNNSGSFLGIALETKSGSQEIKVLTEGYYGVFSSASATPGYLKDSTTIAGLPIYFSGSYITLTKPPTAVTTRPLGFTLNTEINPNQIKYLKFTPSLSTLA